MADNPDLGLGLKYLGKLLGVLGDDGPNWAWFGDPGKETLKSLRANRNQLARVIAALRWGKDLEEPSGDPDKNVRKFPQADSSKKLRWESLYKDQDNSPTFETGVVWNEGGAGDPLRLGIGAVVDTTVVDLDILLWLVEEATGGKLDHRIGTGFVDCDITISDAFLSKISAGLELTRQGNDLANTKVLASIGVTEPAPSPVTKTVTLDTSNPNLEMLGWDLSRIGAFIVGAWLRREAAKPANAGTAWERLGKHVLPLFGGPGAGPTPNPIQPLPPFQEPGTPANPTQWHQSLIAPISGGNTDAAERFLWHARALITGKEATGGLFSGSVYVQIDPPPPGNQPLLDQAGQLLFTDEGALPANPPQTTRYLGALWTGQAPPPLQLIHRQRTTAGADTDTTLFDFDASGLKKAEANFTALSGGQIPLDLVFTTDGAEPVLSLLLGGSVTLALGIGKKPWLKVKGVEFSKDPARGAIELLLALVGLLPAEVKDKVEPWLKGLADLLNFKDPAKVASGMAKLVAEALRDAVGPEIKLIKVGPLTISLKLPSNAPPEVWVTFSFKPEDALADTVGIYIGELNTGVGVSLPLDPSKTPSVKNGSFELKDVRATPGKGLVGFIAELLPDFLKLAGFDLKVTWTPLAISGGGRIPIQSSTAGGEGTSIGPINLRSIDVAIKDNTTLSIGLDASFSLGGLEVAPYNLGVGIDFKTGKPSLQLDGLGLSMDMNGLTLGGMFAKYQPDPAKEPDFLGALQVGVFDLFSLSAIGGYSTIQGNPSLFIFANLDAPLGGPPYFFVTGIAGGFGVNRRLPPVFPLQDNPFLKVMRGEIAFDPKKGMRESLELLGKQFTPEMNAFWIAAGLEFTSFAFINGKVGAAISVPFKFQLFGSAGFGIEDLAYIEIEFGTEVTPEYVLTQAGLSHNSYLIHPDIFGLQGQFALGVWYAGEHAGEFVLSIGGYHPLYTPPGFYPSVERIEVRATLWGYVNLSVSCFFTLTAHEIMAGAAVSLWGEFAGISAGLDVYVDVLIRWDPFYLVARMGVCVWFVFMGRHEIGVDLKIYTPEFGGEATIDLFLVSFTISFGADEARPPPLPVKDFAKNHLRLAPSGGEHSVTVPSFTKGDTQGLFRLDVGWGRTVEKAESKEDESQEGLEDSTAIPVNVEFGLVVKSRMPLMNAAADPQSPGKYKGKLHLPLCEIADLDGHVGVFAEKGSTAIGPSSRRRITRAFPTSAYGSEELQETQASAANRADQVQAAAAAAKTINGMGGVTLEYKAEPRPAQTPVVKGTEELEHDAADFYPLPLQSRVVSPGMVLKRAPLVIRTLSGRTALGGSASLLRALKRVAPASPAAPPPPPKMAVREAALPRVRRLRVAGAARPDPGKAIPNMPAGVTPIPVPASPARRPELAVVRLRMVSAQRTPPRRSAMQQGTNRLVASPRRALAAPLAARQQGSAVSVQVAPGRASYVELSRQREVGGKVQLQAADPRQVVRAIFLGAYGRLVADRWVRGPQLLALPDRTRRLVLIGEDDEAPMFGHPGVSAPMGLEQDTLTVALERHSFAASGCVVEVLAGLDHSPPPLTAVSGREVLGNARHLVAHFPALQKGSAVLLLSAAAADPGPVAEQVRWRAAGADQGALRAVTRDDRAALVIPIASGDAWSLELSIGRDYRLDGVVALPGDPAQLAGDLARAAQWTLLDEKWSPVAARVRAPIAQALERVVTARVEVLP